MDVTLCLTQSTTAVFTCVVDRGSTSLTAIGWFIEEGVEFLTVTGRDRHMVTSNRVVDVITGTLTIINMTGNDNGAAYRCEPTRSVISNTVNLTALGEVIRNLYYV